MNDAVPTHESDEQTSSCETEVVSCVTSAPTDSGTGGVSAPHDHRDVILQWDRAALMAAGLEDRIAGGIAGSLHALLDEGASFPERSAAHGSALRQLEALADAAEVEALIAALKAMPISRPAVSMASFAKSTPRRTEKNGTPVPSATAADTPAPDSAAGRQAAGDEEQIEEVALAAIDIGRSVQVRKALSQVTVDDYAERMRDGARFPCMKVFRDESGKLFLADGFHRCAAAAAAGHTTILASVSPGGRRDALIVAVGANAEHGLPRGNDDKRRAVELLLRDEEWSHRSSREIATCCKVSHSFVEKVRKEAVSGHGGQMQRTVTRGGRSYEMNISGIGRRQDADGPVPRRGSVDSSPTEVMEDDSEGVAIAGVGVQEPSDAVAGEFASGTLNAPDDGSADAEASMAEAQADLRDGVEAASDVLIPAAPPQRHETAGDEPVPDPTATAMLELVIQVLHDDNEAYPDEIQSSILNRVRTAWPSFFVQVAPLFETKPESPLAGAEAVSVEAGRISIGL